MKYVKTKGGKHVSVSYIKQSFGQVNGKFGNLCAGTMCMH